MKKYILLFTAFTLFAASCSKNDDPEIIHPNKITKITCTKNGVLYMTADISYHSTDGTISRITTTDATIRYEYIGNTILESISENSESAATNITHTVSYGTISETYEQIENPYFPNETYIQNQYVYHYDRSQLTKIDWTYRWPNLDGEKKYGENQSPGIDQFTWENGNISQYTLFGQSIMEYEYRADIQPKNFPFRLLNTFTPVELENFMPFNSYFGATNENLIQKATWYNITTPNKTEGIYTFYYTGMGDYITGATINETLFKGSDIEQEFNTYIYTFEYNYNPN